MSQKKKRPVLVLIGNDWQTNNDDFLWADGGYVKWSSEILITSACLGLIFLLLVTLRREVWQRSLKMNDMLKERCFCELISITDTRTGSDSSSCRRPSGLLWQHTQLLLFSIHVWEETPSTLQQKFKIKTKWRIWWHLSVQNCDPLNIHQCDNNGFKWNKHYLSLRFWIGPSANMEGVFDLLFHPDKENHLQQEFSTFTNISWPATPKRENN